MLAAQRQTAILERVRKDGAVRVRALVRELGVSDMTIRRDLEALADRGLLAKVHGGATSANAPATDEPGFVAKSSRQADEKEIIAIRAARLVQPGAAVGLSAGTTTWRLAHHLVDIPGLTVVTNSIPVADVLYRASRSDQTVLLTGGVRTPSDALVGPFAVATIRSLNLDQLFLGVHGMSARHGFTTPNVLEAETDRALIDTSRQLIVLADHTKWETIGLSTIAPLSRADVLVTDDVLSDDARAALAAEVGDLVVGSAHSP